MVSILKPVPVSSRIEDRIIDHVGPSDLLSCSLVCHAWVHSSRRHLFHTLELDSERASKFLAMITAAPVIGQYVIDLTIDGSTSRAEISDGWIYDVLQKLPAILSNLTQLVLRSLPSLHPISSALFLQFRTVKMLKLHSFNNQTSRDVKRIAEAFRNVQVLEIRNCHCISLPRHFTTSESPSFIWIHLPEDIGQFPAPKPHVHRLALDADGIPPVELNNFLRAYSESLHHVSLVYHRSLRSIGEHHNSNICILYSFQQEVMVLFRSIWDCSPSRTTTSFFDISSSFGRSCHSTYCIVPFSGPSNISRDDQNCLPQLQV